MSLPFKTLQEFLSARDKSEIVLFDVCGLLDEINFKNLVAVFTKNSFVRIVCVKKWIKELGRFCGIKIKLKISLLTHRPYMRESGEICLSYKDLGRPSYSFFAIAHETAHFILMCDSDYELLKVLDMEYPVDAKDRDLRSPIEYCANLVTLMILERCLAVVKKEDFKLRILHHINNLFIAIKK